MITFNVLFGGFLVLLLLFFWTRRRFYYFAWKIGGPPGYPILGVIHKFRNPEKYLYTFLEIEKEYGKLFVSWLGLTPFLVVAEPKATQAILTSPNSVNKGVLYDNLADGLGEGLLNSHDPSWQNHRKLINPTFSNKVLLSFFPIFNCEANKFQDKLKELVGSGEMNILPMLQELTLNTASRTIMGTMTKTDTGKDLASYYECVLDTVVQMASSPWLRYESILKMTDLYKPYIDCRSKIRSCIGNQAKQKLSQRKKEQRKDDILETQDEETTNAKIFIERAIDLFENGEFTWHDVETESMHIIGGAFETTSSTIGFVLIFLSMFPEYQDRLYEEIKSVIHSKDSNIDLTYEDIKKMTYMDMVINETMRIMPPVPMIGRTILNDITLPNGVVLPQGMQVLIDLFNMHRDPEYWGPDSTTFNPDNFLPANMEGKHPYIYIPFAKGFRNCIGWRYAQFSLKIILSKILRKYRFTTKFDFRDVQFVQNVTTKFKIYPLLEVYLRES